MNCALCLHSVSGHRNSTIEPCNTCYAFSNHSPFPTSRTDTEQKEKEFLNKLINDHWKYIEGVLDHSGTEYESIKEIEYHYKTAFEHGWRHAKEYHTGSV